MINDHIQAALAAERRRGLLAEAEAARLARQARPHWQWPGMPAVRRRPLRWLAHWLMPGWRSRPRYAARGKRTVLRDGSEVLVRPVQRTDAPLLADGFARLSARSRRMRFLTVKKELSPAELRYFTEIDHHDHEALGAVDRADGRGVGVARYVRSADDSQAAEIAVTVVDEWQGRGLGTVLMAQLSERARGAGIRRFIALVAADNVAMAGLARTVGADLVSRDRATVVYEIPLVRQEERGCTGDEQVKPCSQGRRSAVCRSAGTVGS
jgi:RimJ/RimL family protein N-acetyltransferase